MKSSRLLAVLALPAWVALSQSPTAWAQTATSSAALNTPSTSSSGTFGLGSSWESYPMLQYGTQGPSVAVLQNDLNALGFTVGQATGTFDATTEAQVKAFQQANQLQVDGIVGPLTWGALAKAVAAYEVSSVVASASSHVVNNVQAKRIVFNGSTVSSPIGFTYDGTTYMPIWYVMQALKQAGYANVWANGVWNITPPSTSAANVDYSNIKYGKGSTAIAINGTVVANVIAIVYPDPASGKMTTFMPIWYVMNALKRAGVGSTWQGTQWTMKPAPVVVTTSDPVGNSTGNMTGNSTGNTTGNTTGNMTGNSTGNTTGNSTGNMTGNSTGNTTSNSTGNSSGSGTSGSTGANLSFTNVDLRFPAPANINTSSINSYLLANDSPLNGLGASFMDAQNTYGVDANYLVSHAILESYWGQSQIALAKNNLFGYGAYDSNPGNDAGMFPSDDYAIRFEAWEVRNNYLNPGGSEYVSPTLTGMNVNYATDKQWAAGIGSLMTQFASSVGSSVSAYKQYSPQNVAPTPKSSTEPVFYMNGATGVIQSDSYYQNGGVPYFPSMAAGMNQQFFGPLQNGSAGQPVAEVQKYLNQTIGAGLQIDGQYGPLTEAAVKKFESQVMHMTNPDGIWSYAMWTTYIQPNQSNANLIPSGTQVQIDQIEQGMAGPYVMPWYHIVNYGWVDSQYVKFTNVYRVEVTNPAGTATSIPVYQVGNLSKVLVTLHSGDFVVASSAQPSGGVYTIQIAAQTPAVSNGLAPDTLLTGVIPANGTVTLVPQS
ncbi:hypothetical protein Alches_21370 [Alicyclobacillus hesperidum subsp. aegles]|uniref:peptidoglycan-binding protein n=1 Tax=Alicyclobacillus hesperidum TaxID=89784 RepID=UPI00222B50A9|nr:peptidoglycan-binding protein [Alicyclobacillus hesperidum]GLG02096.1 hypothetical protein Alches_21370 [Alicyclobacillus hesperidum subsp. aegles]